MLKIFTGPHASLAKIGLSVVLVLAIIGSIMWYGHSKYKAGVEATDAKWVEAGRIVELQIEHASEEADTAELILVEKHNDKVIEERKRLEEADTTDSSYFDVLFPTNN